jgi:hypothetical protein
MLRCQHLRYWGLLVWVELYTRVMQQQQQGQQVLLQLHHLGCTVVCLLLCQMLLQQWQMAQTWVARTAVTATQQQRCTLRTCSSTAAQL